MWACILVYSRVLTEPCGRTMYEWLGHPVWIYLKWKNKTWDEKWSRFTWWLMYTQVSLWYISCKLSSKIDLAASKYLMTCSLYVVIVANTSLLTSIVIRMRYAWWTRLIFWGRVTHICVGKLIIIGSDNGLSPGRRQSIIWTNAGILLIRPLGTNFREILSEIHTFSVSKMHLKITSAKWRPFCLGLDASNSGHESCNLVKDQMVLNVLVETAMDGSTQWDWSPWLRQIPHTGCLSHLNIHSLYLYPRRLNREISWSLEALRLDVKILISL